MRSFVSTRLWGAWRATITSLPRPSRSHPLRLPSHSSRDGQFSAINRRKFPRRGISRNLEGKFAFASRAVTASKPGEGRSPEPSSSATTWLSECDRMFVRRSPRTAAHFEAGACALALFGSGLVASWWPINTPSGGAKLAMARHVPGHSADDGALDASLGIGAGEPVR
jgi:hypothetical protein